MWPNIKRIGKKGVKFDENFWKSWGPSLMFYFNPEIFDNSKNIKSIYCMYSPHTQIKFRAEEIAMGIHYECGDFGEHTVLFSYEDIPNIEHLKNWDFCVFQDFSSDDDQLIRLYENKLLMQKGIISELQMYQRYMELIILNDMDKQKENFRNLSKNIVREYIKMNPTVLEEEAYTRFLENICPKIKALSWDEYVKFKKDISSKCEKAEQISFDKLILDIMNIKISEKLESVRNRYENLLSILEKSCEDNDLNSIFQNCRNYFLDKVISYQLIEVDEQEFDEQKLKFVKTGKKKTICKSIEGKIEKNSKGKAVFKEKEKPNPPNPPNPPIKIDDDLFCIGY